MSELTRTELAGMLREVTVKAAEKAKTIPMAWESGFERLALKLMRGDSEQEAAGRQDAWGNEMGRKVQVPGPLPTVGEGGQGPPPLTLQSKPLSEWTEEEKARGWVNLLERPTHECPQTGLSRLSEPYLVIMEPGSECQIPALPDVRVQCRACGQTWRYEPV